MSENISNKYKVPSLLRPLLESFTRETLRNQPADLIEFGLIFFETLQDLQTANPRSSVISDEPVYQQFRTTLQQKFKAPQKQKLPKLESFLDSQALSLSSPKPASVRQPVESPNPTVMQLQQASLPGSSDNVRPATPEALAATKIQAAYRGHFVRNHPEKFGIDVVEPARRCSTDRIISTDTKKDLKRHSVGGYSLEAVNNSPDDRAATKIQAEIRGFLTRKHVDAMKQKNLEAATKIQAHIRGYLTRKKLHDENVGESKENIE